MTQTNTHNHYTLASMNSTSVYNYIKRLARNTYNVKVAENLDCLAEALIQSFSDDTDIDKNILKSIVVRPSYMTDLDFREMECEVITSLKVVPLHEAHVD